MTNILTREFYLEVAKGNVSGHSLIHKFGRNSDIDGAFEAIWNGGGSYTGHDITAAETMETFSSLAADAGTLLSSGTATGGSTTTIIDTGATFSSDGVAANDVVINDTQLDHAIVVSTTETTITVFQFEGGTTPVSSDAYRIVTKASTGVPVMKLKKLLTAAGAETSEYIIMNGVTGVNTTGSYIRHSRSRCHGGDNAGAITTRQSVTTANITSVMPAGYNSTMIACDTIPAGKTGYIVEWFGTLSGKTSANCDFRIKTRPVNDVFQVQEEASVMGAGNSSMPRPFMSPKGSYPPMTDIFIEADTDTNNTSISAGWTLLLVDN